jgi:hypothetical protein
LQDLAMSDDHFDSELPSTAEGVVAEVCDRVAALLDRFLHARSRFFEQLRIYYAGQAQELFRNDEWWDRRRKHFLESEHRDPERQPHSDWEWDIDRSQMIGAWVPPELQLRNDNSTQFSFPLPLTVGKGVPLCHAYTVLALLYNAQSAGLDPIEPWPRQQDTDDFKDALEQRAWLRWWNDGALAKRYWADDLSRRDVAALRHYVRRIRNDLEETAPATVDRVLQDEALNARTATQRPTILAMGDGMYCIPGTDPIVVNASEDYVLQAFIGRPALTESALSKASGVERPRDVIKRLRAKYGGMFAEAIVPPGGKGKGGFRATVMNVPAK